MIGNQGMKSLTKAVWPNLNKLFIRNFIITFRRKWYLYRWTLSFYLIMVAKTELHKNIKRVKNK